MNKCLDKFGTIGGYLGAIVCIASVIGRFWGHPTFIGFNATGVLICGIGLGVFACWAKLESSSAKE